MKKQIVGLVTVAASLSLGASSFATGPAAIIHEGPYGPIIFDDSGTCDVQWAQLTASSTYNVFQHVHADGANVKLVIQGTFSSFAGHAPGACASGTDDGNLITAHVPGQVRLAVPLIITGGTFDPSGTCDISCATNYTYAGIRNFAHAFYGPNATFAFGGPIRELARSHADGLCANSWTLVEDLVTGAIKSSKGDIATTCP